MTENITGAARTGTITFKTAEGDVTAVLNVTQLSTTNETLSLEFSEITLGAEPVGREVCGQFKHEIGAGAAIRPGSPVPKLLIKVAMILSSLFSVTANTSATPRVGIITFDDCQW